MKSLNELLMSSCSDPQFIEKPKVCNEYGTNWVIGFNHMICDDFEYEQLKDGIDKSKAAQLLDQDLRSYFIILEKEYNEKYQKSKFIDLSTGCQYLLLSILYTTGRFEQFTKLIEYCQKNELYEALKYNNRKSIIEEEEFGRVLKQYANRERQFFQENFHSNGEPKNQNEWKRELMQATEDDLESYNQLIQCRFINCKQQLIYAEVNDFQYCNYKNVKWLEFIREQEGQKYNFISYNPEKQKWFPVEVEDSDNLIIGYSHVCTGEEVNYFQLGLTDGQVNYLFLTDYNNNILRIRRYLAQEFPQYEFENLISWVQLFLIDISFRNYTFEKYQESIKFALQGNLQQAIEKSDVYYHPSINVNAHYQQRIGQLWKIFNQIEANYQLQEVQQNSIKDLEKLNNIVGIKIGQSGYNFITNDHAETKINFKDLISFLRVYYDPVFEDYDIDVYFSLDREVDDAKREHQKKVYFPEYLEGSEVGEVFYESDFILKQMSLGIQYKNQQKTQFDYGNLNIQPIYQRDPEFSNRIFLKVGNFKLDIVEDKQNNVHCLTIESIRITVDARELGEDGEEHIIQDPNNAAFIFVKQFSQAYDQISHRYPVFKRLQEVLMANHLAKHMHKKGIQLDFEIIDEFYQQFLIKNYKQYKSPNLSMTFQGNVEVSGGIDGGFQDVEQYVESTLQQLNQKNAIITQQVGEKQTIDMTLSRCYTVDSLEQIITTTNETEIKQKKKKCKLCESILMTDPEIKEKCCVNCSNIKCQKCQYTSTDLIMIEGKTICKNCLKCTQCGKAGVDQISGYYFYHSKCVQLSKESTLKNELLILIKSKLKTIEYKARNNEKMKYLIFEKFECIQLQNYSGCIFGYHHVLYNDPKITIDPKKHRITQQKADEYLNKEFEQAEIEVTKKFISHGYQKVNGIPENIRLLLTFANFILKDMTPFSNQFTKPDYHTLYYDLQDLKCANKSKHTCTVKSKISIGLDFFNERFHKEDGRVREKGLMYQFKKRQYDI